MSSNNLKGIPRELQRLLKPYLLDGPRVTSRENWVGTHDSPQQHADYLEYSRRISDLTYRQKGVY